VISILRFEICFALVLVVAVLATRRKLWLSLHVWAVATSSAMLLTFLYARAGEADGPWLVLLVVGMATKIVALGLLIVEGIERQRRELMGEASRETQRAIVSTVQHLCNRFGSGVDAGCDSAVHQAEAARGERPPVEREATG
jgi:hypothetical protein